MQQQSSIQPWHPPRDFENPVPEPGRRKRPTRPSRAPKSPGRFEQTRSWIGFAVVIAALTIGFSMLKSQFSEVNESDAEATEFFPADGRSQLPGGRVALAYTALPDQEEKVSVGYKSTGRPAWSGTMWALVTPGERSYVTIFEQRFEPALSPQMLTGALGAYNSDVARTTGAPTAYRTRQIDGRDAWVWRYRNPSGERELQAWVVGLQYGHRLQCKAAVDEPAVWRQCLDALENLKFNERGWQSGES